MSQSTPIDPRLVSAESTEEDTDVSLSMERSLRPTALDDFIGQAQIKTALDIALQAAKQRNEPLEHTLLYGNPGLGKTTLAGIMAKEMGANFRVTAGPALERVGDLAAILSNLSAGDVLFIDEIHRVNKSIEEVLYTAMEDFAIDIIVGKGPTARTLRMPVEPFTLIGATTKLNLIAGPLRDRFGHVYHLTFYEEYDMKEILLRNAQLLQVSIDEGAIACIAARSRQTPRIANRLLRRVRDYAEVKHSGIIDLASVEACFRLLGIDTLGLDTVDRKVLTALHTTFKGRAVGLKTLAAVIAEEVETLESIYEPYLLQKALLERTSRGRKITALGVAHLEAEY